MSKVRPNQAGKFMMMFVCTHFITIQVASSTVTCKAYHIKGFFLVITKCLVLFLYYVQQFMCKIFQRNPGRIDHFPQFSGPNCPQRPSLFTRRLVHFYNFYCTARKWGDYKQFKPQSTNNVKHLGETASNFWFLETTYTYAEYLNLVFLKCLNSLQTV